MRLQSKQPGVRYTRTKVPQFDVTFESEPVDVPDKAARILLEQHPTSIVVVDESPHEGNEWREKLLTVPGIGPKSADDITTAYLDEVSFWTAVDRGESIIKQSTIDNIKEHLRGE